MSHSGWSYFYEYRFRNANGFSRLRKQAQAFWARYLSPRNFWETRSEDGYFAVLEDYVSTLSPEWIKIAVIIGALALVLTFLWYMLEDHHHGRKSSGTKEEQDADIERSTFLDAFHSPSRMDKRPVLITPEQSDSSITTKSLSLDEDRKSGQCVLCRNQCEDNLQIVEFKWPSGPLQVYMTGTFLGWSTKVLMTKRRESAEGFYASFKLPKGHHEFKFLIENKWHLSKDYAVCKNLLGEENNYVNLR